MSKGSPFKKLFENRDQNPAEVTTPNSLTDVPQPKDQLEPRKRGRPATGKRSDAAWIGRTFYVKRETDLDIEDELLKLKRQGVEVDKSELVDALLSAWLKWRQGENIDVYLDEITPRRKGES
jgi:hypothetical protein